MTSATLVFALCLITSALCAVLLTRSFLRTKTRLLLWCAIAFGFLAINNALVFVDLVLVGPTVDLLPLRYGAALAAVGTMIYAFIWESE
jgi:hypothetical protein